MSATQQLLKLFQVDKQLRGLRSRLDSAERFLSQQGAQLRELEEKTRSLESQVRQLRASQSNDEGEAQRYEAKIASLREQMNAMKTAKEYNAALTELNNYKETQKKSEDTALDSMGKVEQLETQLTEMKKQRDERAKVVAGAESDRAARESEIKDRLEELKTQRQALTQGISAEALTALEGLIKIRGDEAMCPVETLDRRNHEYSCSGCMMALPVETVSAMLSGKLTRCVSCGCIVYTEEDLLTIPPSTKPASKKSKAKQVAKA